MGPFDALNPKSCCPLDRGCDGNQRTLAIWPRSLGWPAVGICSQPVSKHCHHLLNGRTRHAIPHERRAVAGAVLFIHQTIIQMTVIGLTQTSLLTALVDGS
jgi:hypothetical protein